MTETTRELGGSHAHHSLDICSYWLFSIILHTCINVIPLFFVNVFFFFLFTFGAVGIFFLYCLYAFISTPPPNVHDHDIVF